MYNFLTSKSILLFIPDFISINLVFLIILFLFFEIIFFQESKNSKESKKAFDIVFLMSCFLIGYIISRFYFITIF